MPPRTSHENLFLLLTSSDKISNSFVFSPFSLSLPLSPPATLCNGREWTAKPIVEHFITGKGKKKFFFSTASILLLKSIWGILVRGPSCNYFYSVEHQWTEDEERVKERKDQRRSLVPQNVNVRLNCDYECWNRKRFWYERKSRLDVWVDGAEFCVSSLMEIRLGHT